MGSRASGDSRGPAGGRAADQRVGGHGWGGSWGACGETWSRPPWRDTPPLSVQGLRAGGLSLPCTWGRRVRAKREGCPSTPVQTGGVPGSHARLGKLLHLSPGPQGILPTPHTDAYQQAHPWKPASGPHGTVSPLVFWV